MSYGEVIRRLRMARGWKQEELARRTGIQQAYISKIEAGKRDNPTQETLVKLAEAFEMTVADLLIEAGAVGVRVRPPLPTENLPPIVATVAARFGPYLNARDWERVAGYLEALGRERAAEEAAHGFQTDDQPDGQTGKADQGSRQHGAA